MAAQKPEPNVDKAPATAQSYAADPGRIAPLARQIKDGTLRPVDLVQSYLDRIREVEVAVQAWREVAGEMALAAAERLGAEARQGRIRGPLHGIPVGVKDIIDVAGLPTRGNSRARADIAPASADAEIVARLRLAGAIVLGKTHTTEFAYFDPSPARNPHNIEHTPGGSSSGSAAAVASGAVPLALGTQTFASVNRPAAYCGIAAFKPSTQSLSTFGVLPLSPTFDTVGCFGSTVEDAVALFDALCPDFARVTSPDGGSAELGEVVILDDPVLADASADVLAARDVAADRLAEAGVPVRRAASPVSFAELFDHHLSAMEYEIGRIHGPLLSAAGELVGTKLAEAIRRGAVISDEAYRQSRLALAAARVRFWSAMAGTAAILFPATPATAPRGIAWTGDPKYIAPWTALGGPVVTMPAGVAADGLPIGVLLCGRPGQDVSFTRTACRLAEAASKSTSLGR